MEPALYRSACRDDAARPSDCDGHEWRQQQQLFGRDMQRALQQSARRMEFANQSNERRSSHLNSALSYLRRQDSALSSVDPDPSVGRWHLLRSGEGNFVDPSLARSAARAALRVAREMAEGSDLCGEEEALPTFDRSELVLGELLGRGGFNDVYEVKGIVLLTLAKGGKAPGEDELDDSMRDKTEHTARTAETAELEGDESGAAGSASFDAAVDAAASGVEALGVRDSALGPSPESSKSLPSKGAQQKTTELEKEDDKELDLNEISRRFLAAHCLRPSTDSGSLPDARYAVKHLSLATLSAARPYKTGAADLALEAKLLSSLSHPHLIRIRGVSSAGLRGFASGRPDGYFLILDRLYGTLDDALDSWREKARRQDSMLRRKFLDKSGKKRRAFLAERMKVALDIASVMCYLHGKGVIYRDLKPDNVGFDIRGDVKIFDLGLAKELRPSAALEDGTYRLSGNTGSLRYMAPEVALCQPYSLPADVYSFSLLLHEICSLRRPYDGMCRRDHSDAVVRGSVRPTVDPSWPSRTKCSLVRGWDREMFQRPSMEDWYRVLRKDVAYLRGGDEAGLGEENPLSVGAARRRSTFVLRHPHPPAAALSRGASSSSRSSSDADGGTKESSSVAVAAAAVAAASGMRRRRVTRGALAA